MKNTRTPMIKSKFSNAVHKILELNIDKKSRDRRYLKKEWSAEDKIKAFDAIFKLHQESSEELTNYQYNRRCTKRRDKARVERGWKPKTKAAKINLVV